MSAVAFLDILEQQGLLEEKVIKSLREQVAAAAQPIPAERIAKALIDKGHLTKFQAQKLLAEVPSTPGKSKSAKSKPAKSKPATKPAPEPPEDELALSPLDDEDELAMLEPEDADDLASETDSAELAPLDDDLGLSPLDDDQEPSPLDEESLAPPDDDAGLTPLDELSPLDDGGLAPLDDLGSLDDGGLAPLGDPAGPEALDGGLESLDGGGLDPLSAGDPMQDPMAAGAAEAAPAEKKKKGWFGGKKAKPQGFQPKGKKEGSQWNTPLILLGGGGIVLLLIIGTYLFFALTRGSASEYLEQADDEYLGGSYSQAVTRYTEYLERYPDDPKVSYARVKRGLAMIRKDVAVESFERTVATTKEVLAEIQVEEDFPLARPELSTLLPQIAEGFSEPAKTAGSVAEAEQLVALAEETMDLINEPNYLPSSERNKEGVAKKIDKVIEDISIANRNINRDKELDLAVAKIGELVAAGKTAEAYAARQELLNNYPALIRDQKLIDAVLSISEKERELVVVRDVELPATQEDIPPKSQFRVVVGSLSGVPAEGIQNRSVHFLASGAVYGIDASKGTLLWQRFVGHETTYHPTTVNKQAGADVILVDGRRNDLLRVAANTGELKWRLPIGRPFSDPIVANNGRIYVATGEGDLVEVDGATGSSQRTVEFPQPLVAGPGLDDNRPLMYVASGHSNVYILSSESFECREVYYLGHELGSIVVPPLTIAGYVLIFENPADNYCNVHVFSTNNSGLEMKRAMDPIRLRGGRVMRPPIVDGPRVAVVTDRGEIHVFNIDPANVDEPVSDAVAPLVATYQEPTLSFAAVDTGQLWVADRALQKFEIRASLNKLDRTQSSYSEKTTFAAPLNVISGMLYHMRRHPNASGLTVQADTAREGQEKWRLDIAAPPASVIAEGNNIFMLTSQGEMFAVTPEVISRGFTETPATSAGSSFRGEAFTQAVDLGDGKSAYLSERNPAHVLLCDPSAGDKALTLMNMTHRGNATAVPTPFKGGLLIPVDRGQVLLLRNSSTAADLMKPFQPPLEPGQRVNWHRPAVVANGEEFVIADDRKKLYRIGAEAAPQPHLKQLVSTQVDFEIVSPLAGLGDTVFAAVRVQGADSMVTFQAGDLSLGKEIALSGRVTWGPQRVGDGVLAASSGDGLLCFDAAGELVWKSPLAHGPLAGAPTPVGEDYVMSSMSGVTWRVNGKNGMQTDSFDVGEPLGAGPVLYRGSRLLLSGNDSTLHVIPLLKGDS